MGILNVYFNKCCLFTSGLDQTTDAEGQLDGAEDQPSDDGEQSHLNPSNNVELRPRRATKRPAHFDDYEINNLF